MKWRAYVRINLDDLDDWDINNYSTVSAEKWNAWKEVEPSSYGGYWYKVEWDDEMES